MIPSRVLLTIASSEELTIVSKALRASRSACEENAFSRLLSIASKSADNHSKCYHALANIVKCKKPPLVTSKLIDVNVGFMLRRFRHNLTLRQFLPDLE